MAVGDDSNSSCERFQILLDYIINNCETQLEANELLEGLIDCSRELTNEEK